MYKYLNLGKEIIERIFPCIDQLIDIHFWFLEELRIRQNEQPAMSTLADILLKQFSGSFSLSNNEKKQSPILNNHYLVKLLLNSMFLKLKVKWSDIDDSSSFLLTMFEWAK